MAPVAAGDALGASYRFQARIGQGAFGEVWTAQDTRTGESVAAKLLRPEHATNRDLVARFVTERSVLVGLRHPAIVAVRDLVVEGDRLAIVMDYVAGGSVRQLLDTHATLPPATAAQLARQVLLGLAAAHEHQVLHRDIKPDNVLLATDWDQFAPGAVQLTDFGIARLVTEGSTGTGGLIGTPEYLSPEILTLGHCSYPADVYSAGILLYELLAGRTPFAGPGTDYTVAQRHVTQPPQPLDVPAPLWALLDRVLDKTPDRRPAAAEAAAALNRTLPALQGLPALPPAPTVPGSEQPGRAATVLRTGPGEPVPSVGVDAGPAPELGEAGQHTVYRPMPQTHQPAVRPTPTTDAPEARPAWRNPKLLAAAGAALAVVAVAGYLVARPGTPAPTTTTAAATSLKATQTDQPTPTGLGITRTAEYDTQTQQVRLTITYTAQHAPLGGPFLEILPGTAAGEDCPPVTWEEPEHRRNLPTTTRISTACGWSLNPTPIPAQGSQTVTGTITLPQAATSSQDALQQWLNQAATDTTTAVSDSAVTGNAYPAQRLQDIQLRTDQRIPAGKTLNITVIPVWPGGPDPANPLYKSPAVGAPSATLTAIAGNTNPIRFSDGCAGGVKVSGDGLVVTTLNVTDECSIIAQVGNFTSVASEPFAVVTRGG